MDSGECFFPVLYPRAAANSQLRRPDNCDGTFQENCDSKRAYKNISQILESYGQTSLLSFMNEYWKNDDGTDEEFWEHEWATHGTCISTFDTSCYTNYQPQEEVVDFFTRTTDLFKTLDTYTFLKNAGIVPAKGKTYSLKSVEAALSNAAGRNGTQPQISCDDSGALSQVYYYFNVRGSAQTGEFVAAPALEKSSCPSSVSYPPKPTNTQTSKPSSTASAKPTATLQGSCRVNEDWRPQPTRLFRA